MGFKQSPGPCAHGIVAYDFIPCLFNLEESRLGHSEGTLSQAILTALAAKSRQDFRYSERPDHYHRVGAQPCTAARTLQFAADQRDDRRGIPESHRAFRSLSNACKTPQGFPGGSVSRISRSRTPVPRRISPLRSRVRSASVPALRPRASTVIGTI